MKYVHRTVELILISLTFDFYRILYVILMMTLL